LLLNVLAKISRDCAGSPRGGFLGREEKGDMTVAVKNQQQLYRPQSSGFLLQVPIIVELLKKKKQSKRAAACLHRLRTMIRCVWTWLSS